MACVWPAEVGDVVDPSVRLKTVDGSPFDCYGKKELQIKLGRKIYHMTAVKAKIKAPLLGWDFIKKYKLDTVWGEFGDLYLRDKKAMIMKKLNHVTIPHGSLPRVEAVEVVPHLNSCSVAAEFLRFGNSCVNALVTSPESKQEIAVEYKNLLDKYKEILKPNFKEAKTKHNIEHEIKIFKVSLSV